jgi:Ca-activated chloride channel family protein
LAVAVSPNTLHATPDPEARGGLSASIEGGVAVEMPLTHLAVRAQVSGSLAEVEVEQTYQNPFDERVEAVYTFPLPQDAAVIDMVMVVGGRRIRADLQEREQARRTYEEARERGQATSLLEQERPNIFTQSVANIEPGLPINILITYVEQLPYADARYHFNFPMTIGPRYIPGSPTGFSGTGMRPDTDRVSAASRITPPTLPEGVEAPYDVEFDLELEAGMPIREIVSTSHDIEVDWHSDSSVTMSLPRDQRQPDRDVVITFALAGEEPEVGTLTHYDDRGGFFTLMLEPPASLDDVEVRPKELVFVIDMSGSMSGRPMETSKAAMRYALTNLNPDDTFQIIRFSESASPMSSHPLANTPANIAAGLAYIDGLHGMGGTNMMGGVRAALEPPVEGDRMRIVLFLTDGFIGNETEVLSAIDERLGEARLFALGVGSSVNRYLLDKMAEVGRGTVHYVNVDEPTEEVVDAFYSRFRNPILTDIRIDWGGLDVEDITPSRVPDVFEGTPLLLAGRYDRGGSATVRVEGRLGSRAVEYLIDVDFQQSAGDSGVIPFLWARRTVDELEAQMSYYRDSYRAHFTQEDADDLRDEILDLALDFRLLTSYTSFVAVEERIAVDAGDPLHTIPVSVALPEGMSDSAVVMHLSPDHVQPGDPVLQVCGPDDTVSVTAYFPFGLIQTLALDDAGDCWTSRFLVPREVADGEYEILIALERRGGRVDYQEVPFTVDSSAPIIQAALLPGRLLTVGDVISVEVRVIQPAPAQATTAVLPEEIKFVRIHLPDGRSVRMSPSQADENLWTFHFRIRDYLGSGEFLILVEAVDQANNSTFEELEFEVIPTVASR